MKTKQLIATFLMGAAISFCMPSKGFAQYYSEGGNKASVVIDKKISADGGKNYFDNISTSVKTFTEGNQVSFKIVIENNGSEKLTNVTLTDYLPKYLSLVLYPGVYNKSNNSFEVNVGELAPNETKSYLVVAMIKDLPSSNYSDVKNQLTNKACVKSNQANDCDEAKYYVALKSVPTTGSSDIALQSVIMLSMLGAGFGIRKAIRGY